MNFSGYTVVGDGRFGYRSQTSHSSSQIGDSRSDGARRGSWTEDIYNSSLFNVGENFDGAGISGSMYQTIPSTSHHLGYHGR